MKQLETLPNSTEIILPSRQGLLERFLASGVRDVDSAQIQESPCGCYTEHYAPGFEVVNTAAEFAVIGYTPGRRQAETDWHVLGSLSPVLATSEKLMITHSQAAFAGLRLRIDEIANHCGLLAYLKLASLLDPAFVALTSRFVFPVLHHGRNYRVNPALVRTPWLLGLSSSHLRELVGVCPALKAVIFLGDGKAARQSACYHRQMGDIPGSIEAFLLPHPSGANNARIATFLGSTVRLEAVRL